MHTLTKSNLENRISKFIIENKALFRYCNNVYLFGSVLTKTAVPYDIDLLLVYSCSAEEIVDETKKIRSVLEDELKLPADLTVLSHEELKTTGFLKKVIKYLKVK
ncbi:MAG: nucleotidyltransferase domain-containing protein [Firmicutes bacterium]|nr:nucleotidyltransferase domain-containing protein [Bacillota bacterium]